MKKYLTLPILLILVAIYFVIDFLNKQRPNFLAKKVDSNILLEAEKQIQNQTTENQNTVADTPPVIRPNEIQFSVVNETQDQPNQIEIFPTNNSYIV